VARGCRLQSRPRIQRDDKGRQKPAGSRGLHNGVHARDGSASEGACHLYDLCGVSDVSEMLPIEDREDLG